MSTGAVLFAGGAAGMANWAVAIPPDTLKTRFQTDVTGQYKGVADVYRLICRNYDVFITQYISGV